MVLNTQKIALGSRLRACRNILTLGVRTNLSDYEDWQLELIRHAEVIYYPTAFYADLFDTIGRRVFPNYHTYKYTQDKIKQTALFNLLEIPHPRTRVFYGNLQKSKILNHFQFPFVAKIARGSALGRGIYLIQNKEDLAQYTALKGPAYVQEFLEFDRDLRVVLIGGKAVHAYWRVAEPGEFRTNLAQGATIRLDNIPQDGVAFAVNVARLCRFDDVGLDICYSQGKYWVLEANMKYGRQGFREAGINYNKLMDKMIENGEI
ncbi:MAG: RimK family alpha-L-glutamate ligase [Thermodesulfobacteriota bacterium]|nr:RimK family alpha-L-glutamate ligase [Thermodesulfobacteriota bacterium]